MSSPFTPMDTPNQPPTDAPSPEATESGSATAANLRTALAARLRSAYEQGTSLGDLALACHQPVAEVRELLKLAGVDPAPSATGLVPPPRDGVADSSSRLDGQDEPGPRPRPRVRRPAPARRMPRAGQPPSSGTVDPLFSAAPAEVLPPEQPTGTEPQMGILLGGGQRSPEPPTQTSHQRRRVRAQVLRVGQGTTLTLLPSWRSSIAVSVPTELLLDATGLSRAELPGAELSVEINPDALHDRELRPSGWRVGPVQDASRRGRG